MENNRWNIKAAGRNNHQKKLSNSEILKFFTMLDNGLHNNYICNKTTKMFTYRVILKCKSLHGT